jgi:serine/threonine-protein kinase
VESAAALSVIVEGVCFDPQVAQDPVMSDTPVPAEFQQTVQMQRPVAQPPQAEASHLAVEIIEGTGVGLSQQTYGLRCERLRIASLLLFVGFLAFFVRNLFYLETFVTTADWLLFWVHAAITAVTGMVGWRLTTECEFSRKHLSFTELLVFGGSATFFVFLTYERLVRSAPQGYILPILQPWILLIFVYALFIPNTWRRAAAIIGAMAMAPMLTVLFVSLTSTDFADLVSTNHDFQGYTVTSVLSLALTSVAAVAGVRTMGLLRQEAYEAKQIGQYRLKQPLGSGGMGDVFLAEHVLLKRPCAIKLIKPEKAGDPQALARFEQEVQATARLTHWNTVEIFDYGRAEDGTFYYVMEYLPGMNLDQLVQMHGPLPPERVIHLIAQTCDALEEAHEQQLIHRDIKPANIFAAHRGRVSDVAKLLDFGLAKPLAAVGDSQLTQEGTLAGSPLFMSPEQVTGDAPDARTDIYSLGVVMYFLLSGRTPFAHENPMKIMIAHAHEDPPSLSELDPDIPHDLAGVVMRCLEKDPNHRFPSAVALRESLVDCEDAGRWTRQRATEWWHCSGCPHKKALDEEVFHGHAMVHEPELAAV